MGRVGYLVEIPDIRTRHWWQTPDGHIPYGERIGLGVLMAILFGAAGAHVTNNPWGWVGALVPLLLVGFGILDEWKEGY